MARLETNVNINQAMRNVTMTVTIRGMAWLRLRVWMAYPFLWLGCRILGTAGPEVETVNDALL